MLKTINQAAKIGWLKLFQLIEKSFGLLVPVALAYMF